jgi:hypothetical protein
MSAPILHADSLEERIRCVRQRLVLIQAAGQLVMADGLGSDLIGEEHLWDAVIEAAREASEILEPLTHDIPCEVANWTPANGKVGER